MHRRFRYLQLPAAAVLTVALLLTPGPAGAQSPPQAVRDAVDALLDMLQATGDASIKTFAEARLTEAYRRSLGDGLVAHFTRLREATRDTFGDIGVERMDDGALRVALSDSREAALRLELDQTTGVFNRVDLAGSSEAPAPASGRQGAVRERLRAIEALRNTPEARAAFRQEHLAPALRSPDALSDDVLVALARAAASANAIGVEARGAEHVLVLRGSTTTEVIMTIGAEPPYLIEALRLSSGSAAGGGSAGGANAAPPLTWDGLEAAIADAVGRGFSGTILAVRDGEVVLHESYGAADRSTGRPNTNDTIYGIGSIPIDFTRAAVYLLVQRGALALDDAISRFYPDAPADKARITIRQLLTGRSGLPNFHHIASDADRDLTWIDRAEAESRILAQPLLFEPGTDTSPSHSAFGLLAAIVERASGQTYGAFLREHIFGPAGMTRTGFYGDLAGHAVTDFAVGHDGQRVGDPNIPPNWGPTSWLVMGSGGMYSNPADMHRYFTTLRSGKVLTGAALDGYLSRGNALGASDRGFLFVHAWAGGDSTIYLAQNGRLDSPDTRAFWQRLATLVRDRK